MTAVRMDAGAVRSVIERLWTDSIIPALREYIAIPNLSPGFDAAWREHGHMDRAVDLVAGWMRDQSVPGLDVAVVRSDTRTPLILAEAAGDAAETVLLYGHLDKQPPMDGWLDGLGPWTPVIRNDRLYGRGGADDGYAAFAAIAAITALRSQGLPHARCVLLIEACEESGSVDLRHHIEALKDRIGTPSLVVCLDSGCGTYDRLWITTSLRGLITGTLAVSTLTEGVHSGSASGIVPSSFRIVRQLLNRLEDERTGAILPRELHVEVPEVRARQIAETAAVLGTAAFDQFPFHGGTTPVSGDVRELLLNRTWRPQLEITGAAGLPPLEQAGNVLRPSTAVKVSLRLPPTSDMAACSAALKQVFETDPPHGAGVEFRGGHGAAGWNAPEVDPWLENAARQASLDFFGKEACYIGEGGSIPFMAMLGRRFPDAQFVVTGVLGPHSNAHGPNEFLHLPTAVKLSGCVARVLHEHFQARCRSDPGPATG